jgi:hypothetical protein
MSRHKCCKILEGRRDGFVIRRTMLIPKHEGGTSPRSVGLGLGIGVRRGVSKGVEDGRRQHYGLL